MGNHRFVKIECLVMVGDTESKWFKVAALKLFHPTASPFSREVHVRISTQSPGDEEVISK